MVTVSLILHFTLVLLTLLRTALSLSARVSKHREISKLASTTRTLVPQSYAKTSLGILV